MIGLVSIVILVAGLSTATNYYILNSDATESLQQEADRYLSYLTRSLELPVWTMDDETVVQIGDAYMASNLFSFLEIISYAYGSKHIYSRKKSTEKGTVLREGLLIHGGQTIGSVRLGLSRIRNQKELHRQLKSSLWITAVIIAAMVSTALLMLRLTVSRPLKFLMTVAMDIGHGNYARQGKPSKYYEIAMVHKRLETMAERVQGRERSLTESNRRLQDEIARREKSEHQLQNLTDNVPGLVFQFRSTRDHIYSSEFLSAKGLEIFGLNSDSEIQLDQFVSCLPDAEKQTFDASVRHAVDTMSPWHYEGRFNRPDGKIIWFSGHSVPQEEQDSIVYYGILMDITQRKEMESSLRFSQFIFQKSGYCHIYSGAGRRIPQCQ